MTGPALVPGVVNTFRGCFTPKVPFPKAETAAYLTLGLCEEADLLGAGRVDAAHATRLLTLAGGPQRLALAPCVVPRAPPGPAFEATHRVGAAADPSVG